MICAILFDMGGTLDGDGLHWLERFLALYREFGVDLPRESIRRAFDAAERVSATDEAIASADFGEMIELHVKWQLAQLGLADPQLKQHLVEGFIHPVRKAVATNERILADLQERGFELGVVSNGCGNVDRLCADFGYSPFLSLIVDSRRVGISKPEPAIYVYAAEKMRLAAADILMVGDSFERDIVPAKQIGMKTAWLHGGPLEKCPDRSLVDLPLRRLADLPDALPSISPALA